VITVLNRWDFTRNCLLSLREQINQSFKIIVVDHGSDDGTSERISVEFPEVKLLFGTREMWWSEATNLGVQYAINQSAKYVLTLNNDLVVGKDYIQSFYPVIRSCPQSLIGSVSVNRNKESEVVFAGTNWNSWTAKYSSSIPLKDFPQIQANHEFISCDLLPGRGTLIPVCAFREFGLFDDKRFPHYGADEEFSNRCKKNGYNLVVSTYSIVKSYVDETGLKKIQAKSSFDFWKNLFLSLIHI
jgi:GT2 family glycosyltransferase